MKSRIELEEVSIVHTKVGHEKLRGVVSGLKVR